MVHTKVMTGFMELTPNQQLQFDHIKAVIAEEYGRFGFTPIDTPVLERAEVLLAKAGGETEKQIYRFLKGDNDIALRFDLTVPLARYVVEHYGELVFPFRRSHIGKVYRGERPQKGRFREFYQCDIDVIGEETLDSTYDAEIPRVIYSIFSRLNFGDFTIKMNNRQVLSGLMAHLGAQNVAADVLRIIDKIEKISHEDFVAELRDLGLTDTQVDDVARFVAIRGTADEVIVQLNDMGIADEEFQTGVRALTTLVAQVRQFGVPDANFTLDLSIARGLDYYTGTVYETTLNDHPGLGSICSGGRYDDLASQYSKKKLPGVGISIGLTRLFSQLLELGIVKEARKTIADVLVIPMYSEQLSAAYRVADEMRTSGLCVDVLLEDVPIKKKLRYADKLAIAQVVVVGEAEVASGRYTLQNMETGERQQLSVEELIKRALFVNAETEIRK